MKILPIKNYVLYKQNSQSNKTESGIILGSGKYEYFDNCKVIEVGPDVKEVKVDDIIYVDFRKSESVRLNGETLFLTKECDILGVIEGE